MFKSQRSNGSGGWKSGNDFGRKKSWDRDFDNRGGGRPGMYKATCHDCGNLCEVPFRPTGNRPVFCDNCFKRSGNAGDRRPSFNDRPSFNKPSYQSGPTAPSIGADKYQEQFKAINAKLDAIIKILNPVVPAVMPKTETLSDESESAKKTTKKKIAVKKKKTAKE